MSAAPILEIRDATRRFAGKLAVDHASLSLAAGRVAALLGPSGCGKSTLLRMIAGLEGIDGGAIHVRGAPVSAPDTFVAPEQRGVGLVFQDNALFPHLDVQANVAFGIAHLPRTERNARVAMMLSRLHIEHLAAAWPHMLSGGEQQRVAIARAMAREPSLLLLDEPFSGLDGDLRERVRQSLMDDLRLAGATVLVVTHDPAEAMMIADDLVLMDGGRVLQCGSPRDCYEMPVSAVAARLLGEAIVMPVTATAGVALTPFGPITGRGTSNGPADLVIRPEALELAATGVRARVEEVRFSGQSFRLSIMLGDVSIAMRVHGEPPQVGDEVCLALTPGRAILVARQG